MFTNFKSDAIESISDIENGQVTITFKGGRSYTYGVTDVERYTAAVTDVFNNGKSVGKFVNRATRQDKLLERVAV